MKFLCSAIKFAPKNSSQMIVYGKRHCNCFEQIYKMKIDRDKSKDIQGFIILIDGFETFVDQFSRNLFISACRQTKQNLCELYMVGVA